jgi:hypothetical protein
VLGESAVNELVNEPVPEPSVVCDAVKSGLAVVAQHTPRAVTEASPWEVTLPPPVAVVAVMEEGVAVVTVGRFIVVVNCRSLP